MEPREHRIVEASSLTMEEGAEELLNSPQMRPYMHYIEAVVTGASREESSAAIAQLPLEERYVWRIASALKWGFADFDDYSVAIDRATLSSEDFAKLRRLLQSRPFQFCLFLRALLGPEEMERVLSNAIAAAKQA